MPERLVGAQDRGLYEGQRRTKVQRTENGQAEAEKSSSGQIRGLQQGDEQDTEI